MQEVYWSWQNNKGMTLFELFQHFKKNNISTENISFDGIIDIDIQSPIIININLKDTLEIKININKIKYFIPLFRWIEDNQSLDNLAEYIDLTNQYLKQYLILKYLWLTRNKNTLKQSMPILSSFATQQYIVYSKINFNKLIGMSVKDVKTDKNIAKLQIHNNLTLKNDLYLGGKAIVIALKLSVRVNQSKNIINSRHIRCYHYSSEAYLVSHTIEGSL